MVICCGWHWTAVDPNSSSSFLPMTGEDTGLGALASPLVGYLGKVQERAASLQYCPWCSSKGLTYSLHSYHINLQDSVTLCTNPQCLFPLVSQSLEDVLASLDPVEPVVGSKRKNAPTLEKEELLKPSCKRLRSSELNSLELEGAVNTIGNGQHAEPKTDGEKVNGYHSGCRVAEETKWESLQEKEPDTAAYADGLAPSVCSASVGHSSEISLTAHREESALSSYCGALGIPGSELNQGRSPPGVQNRCGNLGSKQDIHSDDINISQNPQSEQTMQTEKSWTSDIIACKDIEGIKSESKDSSLGELEELVPVSNQLLWRNSDNLCWLDSLLAALLNCKSLRKCKPKDEPQQSSLWWLLKQYEDICAAIQVHQQTGSDGIVWVPGHLLQKATADLQSLRISVFKLLQPKLHCKLGQREMPVFAMPLLLVMDSWVERLFKATFYWEFKCSECKTATTERVMKTLPTFTNIVHDWHPLKAVHMAPCNVCLKKNEMRTMVLERVPEVFALHFVEGLPGNDVSRYTFNFKGKNFSVTTVIQYKSHLKHFVTWTSNADGSWLEYDDLKYPDCKTHQKLQVPANEMHIVFWEVEEYKGLHVCSPTSTFAESPPSENEQILSLNGKNSIANEPLASTPDQSLFIPHNDTDIICALSEDTSSIMDTTVTASVDTSIGATTLLDTFEGLTHNDIITLTLVEVKSDSEKQSLTNNCKTQDLSAANRNETLDLAPDSSSAAVGSEVQPGPDVELSSASSDPESGDNSSSDPTFVPGARKGQKKGNGRPKGKKAAPHTSAHASSEPCKVNCDQPVPPVTQDKRPAVEILPQASPVSSTDNSLLSTNQTSPTTPPPLDQNARWSFLLSKHPLNQVQKSIAKLAPSTATQVRPPPPFHSTPIPVQRQQVPDVLYPKPQLRTENSEDLPVKAADMYGAFGAKRSNTQRLLTSNQVTNTTGMSCTSLPVPGSEELPEIFSLKKHGSHSSQVPQGLSNTVALRYKLMKKLKAKKKKLARLNELLGHQGGVSLRPDSTDLNSPSTVTSSTYDGSTCDDFLSDLLSPATTASNLSPDSTGLLEMLASGQDVVEQPKCVVSAATAVSQANSGTNGHNSDNFLEEFLSQAVAQTPTDMENEALSALELFI